MRRGRGNAVTDVVVGIIGALVGGFLAGELFGVPNAVNGVNVGSIVVAFLGAIVAIAIVRAFSFLVTGANKQVCLALLHSDGKGRKNSSAIIFLSNKEYIQR